jgi:hypothetical protein
MTNIATSIIQKVKNELDVSEDLSSTELYDLLHKHRTNSHPDKFTDTEIKKEAEEKFKIIDPLLKELGTFIQKEALQKKPSELVVYQDYEIVQLKQANVILENKVASLNSTIENNEMQIKNLTNAINKVRSTAVEEKTTDLVNLYKPTRQNLFSLGITFFLTFIIGIITRLEEVANILNKYSPLEPKFFNTVVFAVLVFIPLIYLKMVYEQSKVEYAAKRIKTPLLINRFVQYLEHSELQNSFTEMQVYDFLSKELVSNNIMIRFFFSKIIHIYSETTIDSLKDIFIYNLLNKQLINISNADNLDRKFKIVKSNYYSNYDMPF